LFGLGGWVKTSGQFLSVVLFFASTLVGLSANAADADEQPSRAVPFVCEELMSPHTGISDSTILGESHSIMELIATDPTKNLAYLHPTLVMNAGQRVASWIASHGVKMIPDPNYGAADVPYYPAFSRGVGGKRIIGQYDVIRTVVQYAQAAARGDGAAKKMVTLIGPSGTGKSEFLTILGMLAEMLTITNPDYYQYTYEWIDLKDYPEIYPFLHIQPTASGGEYEHPMDAAMNDSPYTLLPKAYRQPILDLTKKRVIELAGVEPTPFADANPQSQKIRDLLMLAEMKRLGKNSLTPQEEMQVLAQHVRIKRLVVSGTMMAKINAEGKDVDWSGLFLSPNALMINTFGSGHPFSYFLNGKILRSHGSVLMFDEYLRNEQALRDATLEVTENGKVTRGGSQVVGFNAFSIGASNSESYEALKNSPSKATISRLRIVPMTWQLQPYEIMKTLLLMKGPDNLFQRKLEEVSPSEVAVGMSGPEAGPEDGHTAAEAVSPDDLIVKPIEQADLDQLVPEPERDQPPTGPDYRYQMYIKAGAKPDGTPILVHLSPHTLLYMSQVISATRLNTSRAEADKVNPNYSVTKKPAFTDVVTRMMILMKQYNGITAGELNELAELSRYLKEGHFGIDARDAANVWLQQAVADAATQENEFCLTPKIARDVFFRLLSDNAIQYPDNQARLKWITYADALASAFLVPAIQHDIHVGISSGTMSIRSIYDEVFDELLWLSDHPTADEYEAAGGDKRPINKERLAAIKSIYKESQGRDFDIGEILVFNARRRMDTSIMHRGLEEAVTRYLSSRSTDLVAYDDIERFSRTGDGNMDTRAKFTDLKHTLEHRLGYCPHCLREAIALAKREAAKKSKENSKR
jgi:predicted Ser/Thr protein kinase